MEDKKKIVEYRLSNAIWQFLKRYKDEPEINAEEFMQTLEDMISELQREAKDEAQKRLIMAMFTDAVDYLHAIKKRAFF